MTGHIEPSNWSAAKKTDDGYVQMVIAVTFTLYLSSVKKLGKIVFFVKFSII